MGVNPAEQADPQPDHKSALQRFQRGMWELGTVLFLLAALLVGMWGLFYFLTNSLPASIDKLLLLTLPPAVLGVLAWQHRPWVNYFVIAWAALLLVPPFMNAQQGGLRVGDLLWCMVALSLSYLALRNRRAWADCQRLVQGQEPDVAR